MLTMHIVVERKPASLDGPSNPKPDLVSVEVIDLERWTKIMADQNGRDYSSSASKHGIERLIENVMHR